MTDNQRAKEFCKDRSMKLEDQRDDLLIYSVRTKRKVGGDNDKFKNYKDWDVIKSKTAFLCKISKEDVYHLCPIGPKYANINSRYFITSEMVEHYSNY